MDELLDQIREAVASVVASPILQCAPLSRSGGYSPALRLQARFANGGSAFVKVATNPSTAEWLRVESTFYRSLGEQEFLPRYLGFADEAQYAVTLLVLEDLTTAHWPPPWRDGDVRRVLKAIDQFHGFASHLPPGFLRSMEEERVDLASWQQVAENPQPFLSLGFCSAAWLDAALPTLLAADQNAILEGEDLVHQDIRGDNLCITQDGRVVVVDWNWACRGNGAIDIVGWLPSLHSEGGPLPEEILPDEGELASLLAGFWAARAGLPPPDFPGAKRIRTVQRQQVSVALPWATRALGLPPLS